MPDSLTIASLKDLIAFPFRDRDWPGRFAVGSALTLGGFFIPIIPWLFVLGYGLQVQRQTVRGDPPSAPRWDDWGRLIGDGLGVFAIGLVYLLPALAAYVVGIAGYFGAIVTAITASTPAGSEPAPGLALGFLGGIGMFFVGLAAGLVLSIAGNVFLSVATPHYAARGEVAAAFRVREWWPLLWRNKLGYLVAWAVTYGLFTVLYLPVTAVYYGASVCFLICGVIPFLAAPALYYLWLIAAALFGQVYRESLATACSPAPVATAP